MIHTTLNRIRAQSPCKSGWEKLLRGIGKNAADDKPLGYDVILRINGADDALWCLRAEPQHDRLWRAVAVRCARTVQHLMTDQRSRDALDVAERHANGHATDDALAAASDAASDAARAAASDAARAAASAAARAAARADAWDAARAAALAAAWDDARADAWDDAWDAASDAAMIRAGEILLSAVLSVHADPGKPGVRIGGAKATGAAS